MSALPRITASGVPLVLIANPEDDTRVLYADSLRVSGCEIVEAADGREALVRALVRPPVFVITETDLPFIDGYALCEILRRDSSTSRTTIILLTSDSSSAAVSRGRAVGADSILVKPCLPKTILIEMQRLLAQLGKLRERIRHGEETSCRTGSGVSGIVARQHTKPPLKPPEAVCPICDRPLTYEQSHVGGVRNGLREQWDYYSCPGDCGRFQYRQRTHKLRHVS